jgi:enoyl-CoA hydratase/carnithine racemase
MSDEMSNGARMARAALDEHLLAGASGDLDRLGAGYAPEAVLRTHEAEQVSGRDAIVQWFGERMEFFRSLALRLERVDARPGFVSLEWWGAAGARGTPMEGRDEFDIDAGGLITEQRIIRVGRTQRAPTHVRLELEPPVARLVLDRPEKRNAVSQSMLAAMTAAVEEIADAPAIRAVVLSGIGRDFCAGEDVSGFELPDDDAAARFLEGPLGFFETLERLPKAVVVAVHGNALGFGSEVLLVADSVLADPAATFGFAEIDHGAVPSVLVTRGLGVLGRRRALELALTGRRFPTSEAIRLGLVHEEAQDVHAAADAAAAAMAGWSPPAVGAVKGLLGAGVAEDHGRARDFMTRVMTQLEPVR